MSSQQSALPHHTRKPSHQNGEQNLSLDLDPYAAPSVYYGGSHSPRKVAKSRTYSAIDPPGSEPLAHSFKAPARRTSHDAQGNAPRRYLINVDDCLKSLLSREDTDNNVQITIEDSGPKTIELGTAASGGYKRFDVRGTYMLSNLLQELTLAKKYGRKQIVLDEARLNENPVNRMARLIKDQFWPNLTRRMDGSNIGAVGKDPKDWTADPRPRIYIPPGAPEQYEYYTRIAKEHPEIRLDVQWLKEGGPDDDEYVRDLNSAPGILAIEMERIEDTPKGEIDLKGLPFVVPGGRFNELYGWDSYMETLGLLVNDRVDLCESMARHFCFSIRHYGKILNANRSYYLRRTQPPFLTDMALRIYDRIKHRPDSLDFLRKCILAAIKDYYATWMSKPRLDEESGLSKYVPGGLGVPPETEATHFVHVLSPYAKKHNMSFNDFVHAYNYGHVFEPELDEYFLHDRSVRESGHDTSYRLEKVSAHLATVDLNSCLYKYEVDIARTIRAFFGDKLPIPKEWHMPGHSEFETSSTWDRRAKKRRQQMDKLMWDEEAGMFFDYNTVKREQTGYESATTFWSMWAGACTPRQASVLIEKALPRFEVHGGLVSGTEKSRGPVGVHRPNRQWDYPFGWAPQQILAWTGMLRYGFEEEAQRCAYRWIYMCTKAFVDFNGVVVEKYDVTRQVDPHKVTAEYGNQGGDFKGVATEGFGWVNASYVYGLQILNAHMKRALGAVTTWDTFKKMTEGEDSGDILLDPKHPASQHHAAEHHPAPVQYAHGSEDPVTPANLASKHDDVNRGSTVGLAPGTTPAAHA
ncbi:glycoside hydrolase family 37 protein [Dothistroma septosporum NZE10]|uniref:Trehalase n=1 Tax=Dothistroma septosporum (strain NZE10 / CBS 128990) TaxID=675120 RepID=N1PSB6_DOTSN|nr:glycoside hydrolase family 37 protein [Dothistroma septosporum NZE10]